MASNVFYSWQSDRPNSTNRTFIEKTLENAIKTLRRDEDIQVDPVIDRDTLGIPGAPDIATTILSKIDQAEVFVCDITIISQQAESKPTPNPNVLVELGYAIKALGTDRIIMIMNTAYGNPNQLPFDLRAKRVTIYHLAEDQQDKLVVRKELEQKIYQALRVIYSTIGIANDSIEYSDTYWHESPTSFRKRIMLVLPQRIEIVSVFVRNAVPLFFDIIEQLPSEATAIQNAMENRLLPILDNLTMIGTILIENRRLELLPELQKSFYLLCKRSEKAKYPHNNELQFSSAWTSKEVMIRIYVIGALLVYRDQWEGCRKLIEQEVEWDEYYRSYYWSRYVSIMASRAGFLKGGWVQEVVHYIQQHEWLFQLLSSDTDELVGAVCQFDYIQCICTAHNNSDNVSKAYPSFGFYYRQRTEPVITKLITTGPLRSIMNDISDIELANLIRNLDRHTIDVLSMDDKWHYRDWSDKKIIKFLDNFVK